MPELMKELNSGLFWRARQWTGLKANLTTHREVRVGCTNGTLSVRFRLVGSADGLEKVR